MRHLDTKQLEEWKVDKLREFAKDLGISTEGKKAELIERIVAQEIEISHKDGTDAKQDSTPVPETDTVKIKVTQVYKDLQRGQTQHEGDEFDVTRERADQLIKANVAELGE